MNYYVDGYNLLFKTAWARSAPSLEEARKKLLEELDYHAAILNLALTIVFDAPFQTEELKRSHFRSLEIIFTAKGQTADQYLVDCMRNDAKKAIVVTNDRALGASVKGYGARVESVHDFLVHLRKKSRTRLAKSKAPLAQKKEATLPKKEEAPVVVVDMHHLPALSDLDAWEKIFSHRYKNRQ